MTERAGLELDTLTIRIPMRLQRRGGRKLIMTPEGVAAPARKPSRDETLVKALVRAHRWRRRIESGQAKSITDLAEQEGVTDAYVCRLLPLTCLAPDIVEAILDGRQPKGRAGRRPRARPVSYDGGCRVMSGAHSCRTRDPDHPNPDPAAAPGWPKADHDAGRWAVPTRKPSRDETLIKALVRAHRWRRRIESGRAKSITDLAEQEGVTIAYVCRLLPLTCLAPDIVEAILDGRQPKGLRLAEMLGNGPLDWSEQRLSWPTFERSRQA